MDGACSTLEDMRNAYRILVEKPERKRPLRRPTNRWDYNIQVDLKEISLEVVNRFNLFQDS
jgi:hypothetical protein